jgi:hypothetical protein
VSTTQLIASVPLVRAPQAWPLPLGADTGSVRWLVAGVASFLLLFYVYASSLRYAELATVTMGWIVLLQVALLVVDHLRYDVTLPPARWVAVGLILVLQAYLVLAPSVPKSGAA